MDVITDLRAFPKPLPAPVITIGNFDGVHLGHQTIFRTLRHRANAIGGTSIVLTFDPHPLKVLAPAKCPPLLTPTPQKLALIQACEPDVVMCLPFTQEFANQPPTVFVEEVLLATIGMQEIHVGYNFAFGKGREGNIRLLQRLGEQAGFQVHIIEPVSVEGRVVSSSIVREWIQDGRVDEAAFLLGRLYSICGIVVEGYHKGHELGFPTANIRTGHDLIPGCGIYAVLADWNGRRYEGAASIGFNPTFGRTHLSIEIHLFDFAARLYGETIEVHFVKKIREERAFPSVADLVEQIGRDVETARGLLAAHQAQGTPGLT